MHRSSIYALALIIGIFASMSATLALTLYDKFRETDQWKSQYLALEQNYNVTKSAFAAYKKETNTMRRMVVLGESTDTKQASQASDILYSYAAKVDGDVSIYYKDLTTNDTVIIDGDRQYYMASLYKVILTIYILDQIKQGNITMETQVRSPPLPLADALTKIITESNNEYAVSLAQKFGWSNINAAMESKLGIDFNFGSKLETNVKNIGALFEDIALSLRLSDTDSSYLLQLLGDQKRLSKLPKYLPKNILSHNKTGELDGYSHDAAIFYTPKENYILVFMSNTKNPGQTNETMAQMSKRLYQAINN